MRLETSAQGVIGRWLLMLTADFPPDMLMKISIPEMVMEFGFNKVSRRYFSVFQLPIHLHSYRVLEFINGFEFVRPSHERRSIFSARLGSCA